MKKLLLKNIGCSFLLCFLSIVAFADPAQFIQAVQSGDWDKAENLSSSLGTGDIAALGKARDSNGQSVLHLIAIKGHEKLFNIILNLFGQVLGSKTNFIKVLDNNNNTVLHLAALTANMPLAVSIKNAFGFGNDWSNNIKAQNVHGNNPLHLAAACGNKGTYDFLFSSVGLVLGGAHPADLKNNSGLTARQLLAMPPQERSKICETTLFAKPPILSPVESTRTQPVLTCTQLSPERRTM